MGVLALVPQGLHVYGCLASSLDGKITPAHTNDWVNLGSPADLQRLFSLREDADCLVFGASTYRTWDGIRWGTNRNTQPKPPCIVTRNWQLDPASTMFQQWQPHWPAIYIASATPMPPAFKALPYVTWLPLPQEEAAQVPALLQHLEQRGHRRVLVEGGGELMDSFLQARALQTLYLTITPWLIGNKNTPALVTGKGFGPGHMPRCQIQGLRQVGDELFLTLAVQYPDDPAAQDAAVRRSGKEEDFA